jgi:hypothetical protein
LQRRECSRARPWSDVTLAMAQASRNPH